MGLQVEINEMVGNNLYPHHKGHLFVFRGSKQVWIVTQTINDKVYSATNIENGDTLVFPEDLNVIMVRVCPANTVEIYEM